MSSTRESHSMLSWSKRPGMTGGKTEWIIQECQKASNVFNEYWIFLYIITSNWLKLTVFENNFKLLHTIHNWFHFIPIVIDVNLSLLEYFKKSEMSALFGVGHWIEFEMFYLSSTHTHPFKPYFSVRSVVLRLSRLRL